MDNKLYPGYSGFHPVYGADLPAPQGAKLPDFSQLGLYCTGGQPVTPRSADGIIGPNHGIKAPLDSVMLGPEVACSSGARFPAPAVQPAVVAREKNKAAQRAYRQRNKAIREGNEQRIQELERELADLKTQKQTLQQKNVILEMGTGNGPGTASSPLDAAEGTTEAEFCPGDGWEEIGINSTLVLTKAQERGSLRLTTQDLRQLPEASLYPIWRSYITRMGDALLRANNDENSPAAQEVKLLVNEMTALGASIALKNPMLRHSIVTKTFEESAVAKRSPPDWGGITRSLLLSPKQKSDLLNLTRHFLFEIGRLRTERQQVLSEVHKLKLVTDTSSSVPAVDLDWQFRAVFDALRANLDQQHRYTCNFIGSALKKYMKPMQVATFLVTAYPWGPDMLAIMKNLAEEAGEAASIGNLLVL
eukprot:jgi/Botrbrau1/17864/Bobra.0532s0001.1